MDDFILREFIALAEQESFTKAAEKMHVSQPALSKHIALLEKDLRVDLLDRSSKQVRLSPMGKVFLKHAERIALQYDELFDEIRRLKSERPASIRLEIYARYRPMVILTRDAEIELGTRHPLMDIEVCPVACASPLEDVRNGTADIFFGSVGRASDTEGLELVPLFAEPVVAVVRKDHRFANMEKISVSDLDGETVWLPRTPAYAQHFDTIYDLLTDHGAHPKFQKCLWRPGRLDECDFSFGAFVCAASIALVELPLSVRSNYSILGFREKSMIGVCNAIYRKDTQNEAVHTVIEYFKEYTGRYDVSSIWGQTLPPEQTNGQ